jgi:hypothetical protein
MPTNTVFFPSQTSPKRTTKARLSILILSKT